MLLDWCSKRWDGFFSKWLTGEKIEYTHYMNGKTDNYYNQENSLMIYRNNNPKINGTCFGYWNDLNKNGTCQGEEFFGTKNMGFICEWNGVQLNDSDSDGVLDVYETGYTLSNGKVITSDLNKKDTDGDGISDLEEMGNKPEIVKIKTSKKEYMVLMWRAKSNPNLADSDGDGVIDSKDVNPLSKPPACKAYTVTDGSYLDENIITTNFKADQEALRQTRFGKGTYSMEEQIEILHKYEYARTLAYCAQGISFSKATSSLALTNFLTADGTDFRLFQGQMKSCVTNTCEGAMYYNDEKEKVCEFAKALLKDGDSITIRSSREFCTYDNNGATGIPSISDLNWMTTIGKASGVLSAEVSRKGNIYSVKSKYVIFDYYDWNEGDPNELVRGLSNGDMYKMESFGLAKSFYVEGVYNDNFEFKK